jgi:hypothetical protein
VSKGVEPPGRQSPRRRDKSASTDDLPKIEGKVLTPKTN